MSSCFNGGHDPGMWPLEVVPLEVVNSGRGPPVLIWVTTLISTPWSPSCPVLPTTRPASDRRREGSPPPGHLGRLDSAPGRGAPSMLAGPGEKWADRNGRRGEAGMVDSPPSATPEPHPTSTA